jgi:hypothetical protein
MAVIPLTLAISLVLVLTFVAFFLREQMRGSRGGAERDSLLPLEEEERTPVAVRVPPNSAPSRRG